MSADAWYFLALITFPGGGMLVLLAFLDYLDYREHKAEMKRAGEWK